MMYLTTFLIFTLFSTSSGLVKGSPTNNNVLSSPKHSLWATSKLPSESASCFDDFLQAAKFERKTLEVKSIKIAAVSFIITALSLVSFQVISQQIVSSASTNGFTGNPGDLLIFDLRNGYTTIDATNLLGHWGRTGRLLYLAIEAIDVTLYHTGYRTLFLVVLNNLTTEFVMRFPKLAWFRWAALFPIFLSLVDFFEDMGQIAMTILYQLTDGSVATSFMWPYLVKMSSLINVEKWKTVQFGTACMGLTVAVILAHVVLEKFQPKQTPPP